MTERETILHYIARLSDNRLHRLNNCASVEYAAQKDGEPITLTEKALCANVIAQMDEQTAHKVYVFAKSLLQA